MGGYSDADIARVVMVGSDKQRYLASYYLAQEILISDNIDYMAKCNKQLQALLEALSPGYALNEQDKDYMELVERKLICLDNYESRVCRLGNFSQWVLRRFSRNYSGGIGMMSFGLVGGIAAGCFHAYSVMAWMCFWVVMGACFLWQEKVVWFLHKLRWVKGNFCIRYVNDHFYLVYGVVEEDYPRLRLYWNAIKLLLKKHIDGNRFIAADIVLWRYLYFKQR